VFDIQTQGGCGDDVDREVGQRESAMPTQLGYAVANVRQGIFGEVDEYRPRRVDLEAA
jgi:hypothetical protein